MSQIVLFPSPLGVIFSLIIKKMMMEVYYLKKFPSPLGVIFSLIQRVFMFIRIFKIKLVSVSSRSYILSYIGIRKNEEKTISCSVSVSSRSYILSYENKENWIINLVQFAFPSPLGVIFSLIYDVKNDASIYLSFRLLSELYSLLLLVGVYTTIKALLFPSPLGVIFSLISQSPTMDALTS